MVVQATATPTSSAKPAPPSGPPIQPLDQKNVHRLERLSLDLDAVRDVAFVADGTLVVTWAHHLELVAPDGTTRARIPYAEPLAGGAWHDKPAFRATDPHEPNVEIAVLSQAGDRRSVAIYGTDGAEHARFDGAGVRVIAHLSPKRIAFGKDASKVEVWDRPSRARIADVDVAGAHGWAKDGSKVVADRMSGNVELFDLSDAASSSKPERFSYDDDRDLQGQASADAVSMAPDGGSFAVVAGTKITVVDVALKRRAVHSSASLFSEGASWDVPGKLALAVQNQLWLVDRANPKNVEKKTPPTIRCAPPCKPASVKWEAIRVSESGAPTLLGRIHPNILVAWPVGAPARATSLEGDRLLDPRLLADPRYAMRFDRGEWQIVRVAEDERTTTWPVMLSGYADTLAMSPRGSRLAIRSVGRFQLYDVDTKKEIARSPSLPIKTVSGSVQVPRFEFSDDMLEVLAQKEYVDAVKPMHGIVAREGRYALRDSTYSHGGVDVVDLRNSEILWSGYDESSTVHDWLIDSSGERFAAVDYSTEPRIKLWRKGQRTPVVFPKNVVGYVAFAKTHLVVTTKDGTTMGWTGEGSPWVTTCKAGKDVRLIVPVSGAYAIVGEGRSYCILESGTGKIVQRIELDEDFERRPLISDDGAELFAYTKTRVRRWRVADGTELSPLSTSPAITVYAKSGSEILTLGRDGFLVTFDRQSGRELRRFATNGTIAIDVTKSDLVVTLAKDGIAAVHDRDGKRLTTFECPKATDVQVARDDRAIACHRGKERDVFVVPR